MKNLNLKTILLVVSLMFTVACSKQTRTNTWDPSVDEVANSVELFLQESGDSNNASVQNVRSYVQSDSQNGVIYYAESGKTGLASSVASVLDFSVFGLPVSSFQDLASAKVLLLDEVTETGREFTIMLSIRLKQPSGGVTDTLTAAFKTNKFSFDENSAVIEFENFNLTTFDVSDEIAEDFAGIVQFQITDKNDVTFGQFSSLIGFGN